MERCHRGMVQEVGLEPTKPFRAADLQSAAIATMRPFQLKILYKLLVGVEPTMKTLSYHHYG